MTEFRLTDYLEHIQQALVQARDHIEDMHKDAFLEDLRTQQAVTMNLIIIGEAANKIAANDMAFPLTLPRNLGFPGGLLRLEWWDICMVGGAV